MSVRSHTPVVPTMGKNRDTESSALWLHVVSLGEYRALQNLWCLNVSWTCDVCVWVCVATMVEAGELWCSGTARWNKTLPWRDAAGAGVFNMKCSRSVQLFLSETQSVLLSSLQSGLVWSTSAYSPTLWIAAVLPTCISQIKTYTNVHPLVLLHTIFDDWGGSDLLSGTSSRTVT